MATREVMVIGAGASGLCCAAALQRAGCRVLVLDQTSRVGSNWRQRYDRLRLNTSRSFSRLLGAHYPKHTPMFPTREQVADYIEAFARREHLDIRLNVRVQRIDPADGAWLVRAGNGLFRARHVVIATGYYCEPVLPDWPGHARFRGTLIHSSAYRNGTPFRGQDVLVVGPGSSGMEIAYDLARGGARTVKLAVRTPPNVLLRVIGPVPADPLGVLLLHTPPRIADRFVRFARRLILSDLSGVGLPTPDDGPFERLQRTGAGPAVVDREVIDAIRAHEIVIVGALRALDERGAWLQAPSGEPTHVDVDAIIAATGFRTGLEALVGHLAVLDERGHPRTTSGDEAAPGLRFLGFEPVPALFFDVSHKARKIARSIAAQQREVSRA